MKYTILTFLAVLMLAGCKTTENNYRQAYDKVIAKQEADRKAHADVDSLVDCTFFSTGRPAKYNVDGRQLDTRVEYVVLSHFDGNRTEPVPERFCIVVGSFRQVFNARSMAERLRSQGYDAFVVQNPEPTYYVIAAESSMAVEALQQLDAIRADKRLSLKTPLPWVLTPANHAR